MKVTRDSLYFTSIIACQMNFFLIPTITIAGTPRYIPRFNAITEIPILKTSDSEFAFSISDNVEIIGVIASH